MLLAKNCAIIWLRNALKPTRPPTSSASSSADDDEPAHHPHRARARLLARSRGAEILRFVHDVHVMHFLRLRAGSRIRRQFAIQMRGNCGFVQSNTAENEFAELPFEVGGIAVGQARNRRAAAPAPSSARCDARTRTD